jgi:hypothetical protein
MQIKEKPASLVTGNQLPESAEPRVLNHFLMHQEIDFVTSVRSAGSPDISCELVLVKASDPIFPGPIALLM